MNKTYYCPCVPCLNQVHQYLIEICYKLFIFSIVRRYTIWTWLKEVLDNLMTLQTNEYVEE